MLCSLLLYSLSCAPPVGVLGLEIPVPARLLEQTQAFYRQALGFVPKGRHPGGLTLRHGDLRLVLQDRDAGTAGVRGAYLNFQVPQLDAALPAIREAGGTPIGVPAPFALGHSIEVRDPAGNGFHLLELAARLRPADLPAGPFNLGLHVARMEEAERFYTALGFEVHSRAYLPTTLPLKPRGVIALVLHREEPVAGGGALLLCEPHPGTLPASSTAGSPSSAPRPCAGHAVRWLADPAGNRLALGRFAPPPETAAEEP